MEKLFVAIFGAALVAMLVWASYWLAQQAQADVGLLRLWWFGASATTGLLAFYAIIGGLKALVDDD